MKSVKQKQRPVKGAGSERKREVSSSSSSGAKHISYTSTLTGTVFFSHSKEMAKRFSEKTGDKTEEVERHRKT